jgi:hypothetical protein
MYPAKKYFPTALPISSIAWTSNIHSKYLFVGSWDNKVKKKKNKFHKVSLVKTDGYGGDNMVCELDVAEDFNSPVLDISIDSVKFNI